MSTEEIIFSIASLAVSILSFIATIVISVVLYKLDRKREKELLIIEQRNKQYLLEREAERFIIENGDEIDFLPLCVFANKLNPIKKHKRKIYNNFNMCSDEVKALVLEKRKIFIKELPSVNWADKAIEALEIEIEIQELGRNLFYDNAKYIKACIELFGKNEIPCIEEKIKYEDYLIENGTLVSLGEAPYTLYDYISSFFKYRRDIKKYKNPNNIQFIKPNDLIHAIANEYKNREIYCYWNAQLMRYLCAVLRANGCEKGLNTSTYSQAIEIEVKYFEDLYYCALLELYTTFSQVIV